MMRDLARCQAALKNAEQQFRRIDADDIGAEYHSGGEYDRMAGSCYLFLGLPTRAQNSLEATVDFLARKKKSQALTLGSLTLSYIRQRKLDEAAAMMHKTIDAVEVTRGGGGLNATAPHRRPVREQRLDPCPTAHQSTTHQANDPMIQTLRPRCA
ncbi:hypothetical protein HUT19_40435 [Streptomyces sp. NA02950]|uniref:hypothetical protein n=1 Tax=Streptomyces sp. NA02950 TaxID=2742137 RepID=UPI001591B175|nr:hypothetical protein HUT19_40435 [Streptomyces sp. NA02950]